MDSSLKIRLVYPDVTYYQDEKLSRHSWIYPVEWNRVRFYRYALMEQDISIIEPIIEPSHDGWQQAHYPMDGVPVRRLPEPEFCRLMSNAVLWHPDTVSSHNVMKEEGILHHYPRLSSMIRKYRQLALTCLSLDMDGLDTRLEPMILRWLPLRMHSPTVFIPAYWDWRQIMVENDQIILYTLFKPRPRTIWAWIAGLEVQLRMIHSIPNRKTDLAGAFQRAVHPQLDSSLSSDYRNLMTEFPSDIPDYPNLYTMLKIIAGFNLIMDYSWPSLTRELGFLMTGWWGHKMIDTP